ncbi:hypothetical protein [Actinomadura sp. 7K507]|uniref:hypothetical protein n=1 Tax=Actinomadura sp. 7K507 TaxID=2530365 RepID=UPI00104DF2E2|nr:hypothetical protein [Actinomadura sp. 7K507]TDC97268.1 hypothetical protein E1285_04035 [Actinomadura sp. 7K507]
MKLLRARAAVPVAAAALLVSPAPALADAPPGEWRSIEVTGLQSPRLYGVTAPNRGNAWAVGTQAGYSEPLMLRWRGGAWRPQAVPEGTAIELVDVDARHPADVWAVGQGDTTAKSLHWNGRAWTAVPHPADTPMAVSIDSSGSAWSVGNYDPVGGGVFRYEDGEWADQGLTVPFGFPFNAIAARTPRDVWAGGAAGLWHYDGETWQQMAWPYESASWILQIVAVSADDVWFWTLPRGPLFPPPELVHWDGESVTKTVPPDHGGMGTFADDIGFLGDIASDGRGGVWLQENRGGRYLHYDGATWTAIPRPGANNQVFDLEQMGGTQSIWSVGLGTGDLLNTDRFR